MAQEDIKFSFALINDLVKELFLFRQNGDYTKRHILHLMPFRTERFIYSAGQCKAAEVTPSGRAEAAIAKMYGNKTPEQLVEKTIYKGILTSERNVSYPYISIYDDVVGHGITGTVLNGQDQEKAKKHIQALCKEGKEFIIYDKYFNGVTKNKQGQVIRVAAEENYKLLRELLPEHTACKVTIYVSKLRPHKRCYLALKSLIEDRPKWNIKVIPIKPKTPQHHDRFLIIDNKLEIILSSGFDRLSSRIKDELTYVINKDIRAWK